MNLEEYKKKNLAEYCFVKQNGLSDKKIEDALEWHGDFCNTIEEISKGALRISKRMNQLKKEEKQ